MDVSFARICVPNLGMEVVYLLEPKAYREIREASSRQKCKITSKTIKGVAKRDGGFVTSSAFYGSGLFVKVLARTIKCSCRDARSREGGRIIACRESKT